MKVVGILLEQNVSGVAHDGILHRGARNTFRHKASLTLWTLRTG